MQTINLNIIPKGIPDVVNASQYDVGREVQFALYDGVTPYSIPLSATVQVAGKKGDNTAFCYDNTEDVVSFTGNVVTVKSTQQMTAYAGEVLAQLRVINNGVTIATCNFKMFIQVRPDAEGDISETDIPAIISLAEEQMLTSEAWAVGTRNGSPVSPSDPQYQNNAAYYASQASDAKGYAESAAASAESASNSAAGASTNALKAEGFAVGEQGGTPVSSGTYYHNNSKYYNEQAGLSATSASNDASSADTSAETAEAFGAGTKDGSAVPSTSPAYHNNAKYYSELCAQYAQQFADGVVYKGNTLFANIPSSGMKNGDMYNVTDAFTTDNRFSEGAGVYCQAGQNIIWNNSISKWDLAAQGGVSSFNGRYGAISPQSGDYTAAMTGAVDKTGDTMSGALTVQSNITATGEIDDGANNRLSEKFDANSFVLQKYRVTVSSSAWSSTATDGYYTCPLTLTYPINTYKEFGMELTGSTDGTDPTAAESAAYSLVNYMDANDGTGVTSATLRAKTKPTTTFYIMVHGYYMQKNAATSGVALDIETANPLNIVDATGRTFDFDGSTTHYVYKRNFAKTFLASGWSSTVNASGYYTNTIGLDVDNGLTTYNGVNVSLIGTDQNTLPTAAEIAAYNLIDYFSVPDGYNSYMMTAYAKTKPTTDFTVRIKGERLV